MIIVACRKPCLQRMVQVKEGTDRRGELGRVRKGWNTNQWVVIYLEISKQPLRTIQERSGGIRVQETRYDQVSVNAISSHRISGDQEGCSPISMKLAPMSKQAFSYMEPRPCVLTYLVDLLSREILEVGVGGHDGHRKSDRKFAGKALVLR
jgi:hypothetical protein